MLFKIVGEFLKLVSCGKLGGLTGRGKGDIGSKCQKTVRLFSDVSRGRGRAHMGGGSPRRAGYHEPVSAKAGCPAVYNHTGTRPMGIDVGLLLYVTQRRGLNAPLRTPYVRSRTGMVPGPAVL